MSTPQLRYRKGGATAGKKGCNLYENFAPTLASGTLLKNTTGLSYTVKDLLGYGGYAKVYSAKMSEKSGVSIVALKVWERKLIDTNENPLIKNRLRDELDLLKECEHENIVEFIAFTKLSNYYLLSMGMCVRKTIRELIFARGLLTTMELKHFGFQLIQAAKYLHTHLKVIHRDLKPSNLLITETLVLKVGDFGMAVKDTSRSVCRFKVCGTPNYLAPEMIKKTQYSFPVDVWAIGCCMYEMVAGQMAFANVNRQQLYASIEQIDVHYPHRIGASAKQLLEEVFESSPKKRMTAMELEKHAFFKDKYNMLSAGIFNDLPHGYNSRRNLRIDAIDVKTGPMVTLMQETFDIVSELSKVQKKSSDNIWTYKELRCVASIDLLPIDGKNKANGEILVGKLTDGTMFSYFQNKQHIFERGGKMVVVDKHNLHYTIDDINFPEDFTMYGHAHRICHSHHERWSGRGGVKRIEANCLTDLDSNSSTPVITHFFDLEVADEHTLALTLSNGIFQIFDSDQVIILDMNYNLMSYRDFQLDKFVSIPIEKIFFDCACSTDTKNKIITLRDYLKVMLDVNKGCEIRLKSQIRK